jgi:hypothetical protein
MAEAERRQQLKLHFEVVKKRLLSTQGGMDLLTNMRSLFEGLEERERDSHVLYWPSVPDPPFTLVTLDALEERLSGPETLFDPGEYVYYDFVRFLSKADSPERKRPRSVGAAESPSPPPTVKRRESLNLLPWVDYPGFTPSLFLDAFTPSCSLLREHFSQGGTHHTPCHYVDLDHHKLSFTLPGPLRLKLCDVRGGEVHLSQSRGEAHHLILSNCVLRPTSFTDLVVRIGGQAAEVEYTGSKEGLDLRLITGVNQLCYVTTRSPLSLHFCEERPGLLLLSTETACELDLRTCFLEHWTDVESPPPFRFVVEDCAYLERLCRISRGEAGEWDSLTLPSQYCNTRSGFCEMMHRYQLLRHMKVRFVGEGVPYFFIEQEAQRVTLVEGVYTLVHQGLSLATFTIEPVERLLRLRLIHTQDSVPANPLHYHIY